MTTDCGNNASLQVEKCSTMMYMVCITVSLWVMGVRHEQKENISLKENISNYGQPLIIIRYGHPPSPDSSFHMFIMKNLNQIG